VPAAVQEAPDEPGQRAAAPMGAPLTVLAALVVVWAFRRTTTRLVGPA
jgi:hypothetical protein